MSQDERSAVIVKDLYKSFRLPHEKASGLKQAAVGLFNGKRGYEKQHVLKDISFEIKKGEFFGIVGRNGSGKSTLLKLLAGIYAPDKGLVQVNGSLTPFIELGVGFNPELTGRENVFLNGALLGFSRAEMEKQYDAIVEFAELGKFMDQKLKNYSSGMQVRLAFSIAIRANSDILLLDEVLAVGDAAFQAKCYDYFYQLKNNDATVIFISHDRSALERFCTRGVLIDDGQIIESGSMKKVVDAYSKVVLGQMSQGDDLTQSTKKSENIEIDNLDLLVNGKKTKTVTFGQDTTVSAKLTFKKPVNNPIVGLTLWKKGVEESAIYAANNLTEELGELGSFQKDDTVAFNITLPRYINDGEYRIELGVANESATNFYLQERNALAFKVFGSVNPHAILASPAAMIVDRVTGDE